MYEGLVTIHDETDNYRVIFQEADGYLFFHLKFYNWGPSVYKELIKNSEKMFKEIKSKGYDIAFTYTDKPFIIKLAGKIKNIDAIDTFIDEGVEYTVVAWDLED